MKILIAGASGFVGQELTKTLSKSHQITVLGRDLQLLNRHFSQEINKITWDNLDSCDAKPFDLVINLSGSNIAAKRWNESIKKELIDSRVMTNKRLIHWLEKQEATPRFFCANAVGIYGASEKDLNSFDEDSLIDLGVKEDFLKQIGLAWEKSLQPAIDRGLKVVTLRFGVVLKKGEGMLKKLELPFSLGLGSILAEGKQVISWVHYADLVQAVLFLINHSEVTGAINVTAPHPVSQKKFATTLAHVLKRPLFLKMPAFLIRALFGEMGECLLLKGQSVLPKRLIELGFVFSYPDLNLALEKEYRGS